MNITELKERLPQAVERWAEERIDALAADKPELAIASVYIKRAARNVASVYMGRITEHIDAAALFLADENGNIDTDTLMQDVMSLLRAMPETTTQCGILQIRIGVGKIQIGLPDNIVTTLLLGDRKTIALGEEDLTSLKNLIVTEVI